MFHGMVLILFAFTPASAAHVKPAGCEGYGVLHNNTDLAGDLLKVVRGSLDDCCTICDATPGCGGWSWFQQVCYLKTNLQGTFPNPGRQTREKMLPGKCTGFSERLLDHDLCGDLIASVYAPAAGHYCTACSEAKGCQGFSYFAQKCYLKAQASCTFANAGRITQCIGKCPSKIQLLPGISDHKGSGNSSAIQATKRPDAYEAAASPSNAIPKEATDAIYVDSSNLKHMQRAFLESSPHLRQPMPSPAAVLLGITVFSTMVSFVSLCRGNRSRQPEAHSYLGTARESQE